MAGDRLESLVRDGEFPAADLLLGPRATDVLAPAVADDGGSVLRASLRSVDYTPGRSCCVSYDATIEWSDRVSAEVVAVTARAGSPARGQTTVDVAGTEADVWRYPADPHLPGLARAVDPGFVDAVLDALGLAGGASRVDLRSYSAASRAVVEVAVAPAAGKLVFRPGQGLAAPEPEPVLYLKVVRPERAGELVEAHRALDALIPVPRCLDADTDLGILALAPLGGSTLWDCVVDGVHRPLDADDLLDVLERIERAPAERDSRLTSTEAARRNMDVLGAILPDRRGDLDRFRERLGEDTAQPEVTVHGDFHEVQLLVDERGLAGVLDLDDVGRGQRLDDMAMMLGRLWAFAHTEPSGGERAAAYFWELLEGWERHVDARELRRRVAAVNMSHALQPFRSQEAGWRSECADGIARASALLETLLS